MRHPILTLVFAVIFSSSLQANAKEVLVGIDGRALTPAEIDATVTHVMKGEDVARLALGLINNGRVVYLRAYGAKDRSPLIAAAFFAICPKTS